MRWPGFSVQSGRKLWKYQNPTVDVTQAVGLGTGSGHSQWRSARPPTLLSLLVSFHFNLRRRYRGATSRPAQPGCAEVAIVLELLSQVCEWEWQGLSMNHAARPSGRLVARFQVSPLKRPSSALLSSRPQIFVPPGSPCLLTRMRRQKAKPLKRPLSPL